MIKIAQLTVLVALAASSVAIADEPVPSLARLGGTEFRRGDIGFEYCGPTIVTDQNDRQSPSYAVATIKEPNEKRRLLFLMVFDYGGKQITGAGWSSAPTIEGHDINDASTAIIDNTKKISFAFGYNTEKDARETFSINGKILDGKAPRVFIVDLSAKTPSLKPVDVALPKNAPDLHGGDAKRKGTEWRTMIDELKRSSPEIKTFIEGYAKR